MDLLNSVIHRARLLNDVPESAALAYTDHRDQLTGQVDERLEHRPDLHELIGEGSLDMMRDNHRNHASFMTTIFKLNSFTLLARIIPWVYRTYHAHGFSHDYFPVELKAWQEAIQNQLPPDQASPLLSVYEWMLSEHDTMIELAGREELDFSMAIAEHWRLQMEAFVQALVQGRSRECQQLALDALHVAGRLDEVYLNLIQPAMYEVGRLWETGAISVAREHLASSIVSRIISLLYLKQETSGIEPRGKAVITSAPNEFHEIGAWIVSDLLEQDGWEVHYLGANTPQDDLLAMLREVRPDFVAISVTMPFNLAQARDLIRTLKSSSPASDGIRIMIGGGLFNRNPELCEAIGGDGCAADGKQAVELARSWFHKGADA
ncbi:MAG: cobalamin B12-binding domain-containing protein [Desulfohalobiaceae bacterium]